MADKRKQRIRAHMAKTGMTYQAAMNDLEKLRRAQSTTDAPIPQSRYCQCPKPRIWGDDDFKEKFGDDQPDDFIIGVSFGDPPPVDPCERCKLLIKGQRIRVCS